MLCKWYQWRISSLLSEKSPIPEDVQEHLSGCEHCRAFYEQSRNLEALLSASAEPAQPAMHRWRPATLLAIAAVLVAAVLLSVWWASSHKLAPKPSPQIASPPPPKLPGTPMMSAEWLVTFQPVIQEHLDSAERAPTELLAKVQDTRDYMLSYLPRFGDGQDNSPQ